MKSTLHLPWQERQSGEALSRNNDYRTPYQRDRARIIHSAAFRRLQSKTQILAIRQNDYSRTRLTHSLEVAQIGSGIIHQLKHAFSANEPLQEWLADEPLMETICLSHDIGHPPFGHGGEVALNFMMTEYGGFEGNGQSLRILGKRGSYSQTFGMDITRRSLLGVLKYPVLHDTVVGNYPLKPANFRQIKASIWSPPKCVYEEERQLLEWVLLPFSETDKKQLQGVKYSENKRHKYSSHSSFDASIMDLADDIAYGVHDLEDAIVLGMVTLSMWEEHLQPILIGLNCDFLNDQLPSLKRNLFSGQSHLRKDAIGQLVSWFITSCSVDEDTKFDHPLLRFQANLPEPQKTVLNAFKDFEMQHIILRPEIQMLVYKGQQMIMETFDALSSDPMRLLPSEIAKEWLIIEQKGGNCHRIICDYIASMTDDYASRLYNKLFVPSLGSVFEPM